MALGAVRRCNTVATLFSLILSCEEFAVICSAINLENGRAWPGVEGGRVAAVGAKETGSSPPFVEGENPGVRNAGANAVIAIVELLITPCPCDALS